MINLLPNNTKKQLRAARMNTVIRRYYTLLLVAAMLLAGIFAVGFKVTIDQEARAVSLKAQNEQNAVQYQDTRKAAEEFTKDLAAAKTILASDVRFSQLITDIAAVIPSGTILSNLSLNTQESKAPLIVNARAKTYEGAVALKNSFEKSPIFENVSLANVTSGDAQDGTSQAYPITITLSVKFSKQGAAAATTGGQK